VDVAESQDRSADDDERHGETSDDGRPTARREDEADRNADPDEAASTVDESKANGDEDSTEHDPDASAGSTEEAEDSSPEDDDSADDDSADDDSVEDGPTKDSDDEDEPDGDDDSTTGESAEDDGDRASEDKRADGQGDSENNGEEKSNEAPDAVLPPLEPAPFMELLAAYHQPATAGAERLPWSWATLSPEEREASATVLDGFVESYNRTWAMNDQQTVPPCWHHHPALAHDLAALAWAYYQAYRDPMATPDRALRFQAHLPRFAERVDRWLGADPAKCRDGRHPAVWRESDRATAAPDRSTDEDADAVLLLGRETFGFLLRPSSTTD